ncbi:unnamed protein product [Protopolystoma xenopodis]|uniref:Uncharacterized protein n=1 Tax=Protopolystoma xenopodis TaxID=117903 RepID=A0A3S5CLF5_9PLAT|nr:unnamed protein product [Protopolystoma xenopodis]
MQTTFQRNKAESTYGVWLNPITRLAQICRAYHLSGLEVIPTCDDVRTSNAYSDGIPTSIIQPVCASKPEVTCNKAQTRPSSVTIYSSPVYKLVPCSDPSIVSGTKPEFLYQVFISLIKNYLY